MATGFEQIVIVFLENATRDAVLGNAYMRGLRSKGVFLKNSVGLTHPSQPNYIAVTGGDIFNLQTDDVGWVTYFGANGPDDPTLPAVTSIVDLLEARGFTWKAYAEDLTPADLVIPPAAPVPDSPPGNPNFARRHVPFLSYPKVMRTSGPSRIVPAVPTFENDLAAGTLPEYCFYTPNLIRDGHSLANGQKAEPDDGTNVDNIAGFLKGFLGDNPLTRFPPETPIVITFDESYPYEEDYGIYTLLIGDMLEAGTTRTEPYNHYSLLRSVEVNFGLGTLGRNDLGARPYWFLTDGGC
jgi:Phosphoesterase family